jgi:competence protein ComEC
MKNRNWLKCALVVFFFHCVLGNQTSEHFVIFWNTGQGQWITAVTPNNCLHFDFGGEISFWGRNKNLFLKLCKKKKNVLYLTHADKDHYAYIRMFSQNIANLCWAEINHPQIPFKQMRIIPLCHPAEKFPVDTIYNATKFKTTNENSRVYSYKNILIPGDSAKKQEKIWAKLDQISEQKLLVVGHHGSKTSTSDLLVNRLHKTKMAIVQARFRKYGHPHKDVVRRLKTKKIPILRTEEWGNIIIRL